MYLIVRNPIDGQKLDDIDSRMDMNNSAGDDELALDFIGQKPDWVWDSTVSRFKKPNRDIRLNNAKDRKLREIEGRFEQELGIRISPWSLLLQVVDQLDIQVDGLDEVRARRAERISKVESAASISPEAVDSVEV